MPQTQNSNRIVLEASIKCLYCTLAILCPCYSAVPKIEIGSNHVKKTPNKWDPRISLWSFPDEFQPADVVEPQSWHQGIHIVKVDLSSNRCFQCCKQLFCICKYLQKTRLIICALGRYSQYFVSNSTFLLTVRQSWRQQDGLSQQ